MVLKDQHLESFRENEPTPDGTEGFPEKQVIAVLRNQRSFLVRLGALTMAASRTAHSNFHWVSLGRAHSDSVAVSAKKCTEVYWLYPSSAHLSHRLQFPTTKASSGRSAHLMPTLWNASLQVCRASASNMGT